jgi:hypothetical protein
MPRPSPCCFHPHSASISYSTTARAETGVIPLHLSLPLCLFRSAENENNFASVRSTHTELFRFDSILIALSHILVSVSLLRCRCDLNKIRISLYYKSVHIYLISKPFSLQLSTLDVNDDKSNERGNERERKLFTHKSQRSRDLPMLRRSMKGRMRFCVCLPPSVGVWVQLPLHVVSRL